MLLVSQVLGLEALITRDVRKTHELLLNHLKMIRRMPLLENATAVLSFECVQLGEQYNFHFLDLQNSANITLVVSLRLAS